MADERDTAARAPVPADEPDWLTLGQAAKYLGVAQSTIRKWSDTGRLPRLLHARRPPPLPARATSSSSSSVGGSAAPSAARAGA